MAHKIERKFLLSSLPSGIDKASKIVYERYFLRVNENDEIRIQRKGDTFYREHKITISNFSNEIVVTSITAEDFDRLKLKATGNIERDSYSLPNIQNATVKVYHCRFEGLIRAEVEFASVNDATHFAPPDWIGQEITDSDLGRDSRLLKIPDSEFRGLLEKATKPTS